MCPYFGFKLGIHIKVGIFSEICKEIYLVCRASKIEMFPVLILSAHFFPPMRNSGFQLVVHIHDKYVLFNV